MITVPKLSSRKVGMVCTFLLLVPGIALGQDLAGELAGMQHVLNQVYEEMIPLAGELIGMARVLGGFGALWYIASRVWRHLAEASPIDVYPLLRPFALGLAILFFPSVLSLMNGILQPTVRATAAMVGNSNAAIAALIKQKEAAVKDSRFYDMYVGPSGVGDADKWYKYTHPDDPNRESESFWEGIGNDVKFWMSKQSYNFRNSIKQWMSEVLQVLFASAALCINTIRTFYLIVLAILGPLVLGFAVYDGLHQSLTQWIARYINVFLWLPVANIFGSIIAKIQENMLKIDLSQIVEGGDTFFSTTDTAYLIFMVIGIAGYASVPSIASYIVYAGGTTTLMRKAGNIAMTSGGWMTGGGRALLGTSAGKIMAGVGALGAIGNYFYGPSRTSGASGGTSRESGSGSYLHDKLSGK